MVATNDLLTFATGGSANVASQSAYSGLSDRTNGFQAGTANSANFNKAMRQAAFVAAMIGQVTADKSGNNTVDDGNVANFEANFVLAMKAIALLSLPANASGYLLNNGAGSLSWAAVSSDFLNGKTLAGTANAITATCAPTAPNSLDTGTVLIGALSATNSSTAVTLKADGSAAIAVYLANGATLPPVSSLLSGHVVMFRFDGTHWCAIFDFTAGAAVGSGATLPANSPGLLLNDGSGGLSWDPLSSVVNFYNAADFGGTANALTATCVPTAAALTNGSVVVGKITTTNTGAATATLNGTSYPVKDSTGAALAAGALNAGHIVMFRYDGTNLRAIYDQSAGSPIPAASSGTSNQLDSSILNLLVRNNVSTPGTKIDITFQLATLLNSAGGKYIAAGTTITVDLNASGAGGMDTGSRPSTGLVWLWLVSNGTTTSAVATVSAWPTLPTLPSGYTYCAYVGAARLYSNLLYKFTQRGQDLQIAPGGDSGGSPQLSALVIASGGGGSAVSISGFAPLSSSVVTISVANGTPSTGGTTSPNDGIGQVGTINSTNGIVYENGNSYFATNIAAELVPDASSSVYLSVGGSAKLLGWRDGAVRAT